ncbi:MAG: MATE family Na+-driven efflux transporter [Metamycoplasmataceae bacterium]
MMVLFKENFKNFNWKLFVSLIIISLIPTIYTTVRIYILGDLDDPYTYSIAAQVQWLNIFFEIIHEAIIIPLFFLISKRKDNVRMLANRIKTGFYLNVIVYFIFTMIFLVSLQSILNYLIEDVALREKSAEYMYMELISSFFASFFKYLLIIWMILNMKTKIILNFTVQMILIIIFDTFLVSKLNISLNLSIVGIAISNLITNIVLIVINIFLLNHMKIKIWVLKNLNFKWMIQYSKIGFASGLESMVRNLFFTFMVLKILNDVNGSGNYWVANSFVWSWLLIPILALGDVIKVEGDSSKIDLKQKFLVYTAFTTIIVAIWAATIPAYGPFIHNALNVTDYQFIVKIIMILLPFYILFAYNNIIDALLIGWGRTDLLLYQSIFANVFVYVPYFISLQIGLWIPSVESIAIMFGVGMSVDSILTLIIFVIIIHWKRDLKFTYSKKQPKKTFIFGIPTAGKSTFVKNNPDLAWDSDNLYHLTATLNEDKYDTFDIDHKLSSKLISTTNKKLLKSSYEFIFYSILPISLYEEIDWLLYKNVNIIFVNRSGEEYQYELCERETRYGNNYCDLSLDDAIYTSEFIEEQSVFFDAPIINLKHNEYISEITSELM